MSGPWLGFDTTGEVLSVVVAEQSGRILAEVNRRAPRLHASLLMPTVSDILGLAGVTRGDIAAIVANRGPGSYTGIRIGLAALSALSRGLGCPGYGVPGLLAAAHAAPAGTLCAGAIDARRGDVFCALYESAGPAELPRELRAPALRPFEDFLRDIEGLGRPVRLFGDAVLTQPQTLADFPFAAHGPPELRALDLVRLAHTAVKRGGLSDALSGVPLYLRP